MSKLLVSVLTVWALMTTISIAAEKKAILNIDVDALRTDTQVSPAGAGDDHAAFVWWVPNEFWLALMARDATTSEVDKKAMLDALSGISLLTIVQADITSIGAFKYYSKEEIEKNLFVSFTNASGKKQRLQPIQNIGPDLEVVLSVFKPILGAAMGNLGKNLHFYVFNDLTSDKRRLIDPYRKGLINVQLVERSSALLTGDIEMPLNALFVPRKCPNGKDAHISWNYCPWSGKQLED